MLFEKVITSQLIVLDLIKSNLEKNNRLFLTYLNQHCFNVFSANQEYKNLLENKFKVYADGIGINLANRILFHSKYKQFNATDLNESIIRTLIDKKIKFFILGGNFNEDDLYNCFNTNGKLVEYHNGYFKDSELSLIAKKINDHQPVAVLLGMGVPRQEIIASKLSEYITASLFLCVGNFFEFYLGTVKRIPNKYRDKGVEWIYRLLQEPKRLWKRYFIGIPLFIFRVIKFKLSINKNGSAI